MCAAGQPLSADYSGQAARRAEAYWLWFWVAVACLFAGLAFVLVRSKPGDTAVYRLAAQRFLRGETIYRQDDQAAFTYPPFFVLAYVPFSALPQPWDRALWLSVNLLLAVWVVRTTLNAILENDSVYHDLNCARKIMVVLVILALQMRFIISPITYQSHEFIVLSLVVAGIVVWPKSNYVAGVFWGIAAACKATPLLFLAVLLWRRDIGAVILAVAALVMATLLPDWLVQDNRPGLMVAEWYNTFVRHVEVAAPPDVPGAWREWNVLNQSLAGTLYRLTTHVPDEPPLRWNVALVNLAPYWRQGVVLVAQCMVAASVLWATWRKNLQSLRPSEKGAWAMAAATLCAMLLLSPMSSRQHFCALAPAIAVSVVQWVSGRERLFSTVALVLVAALGGFGGKDLVGPSVQVQLSAYGAYTWCAFASLAASVSAAIQCRR